MTSAPFPPRMPAMDTADLSEFDRRLLERIQQNVPLTPKPWDRLAGDLDAEPRRLLERLAALRGEGGVIREISGIFDAARLGYAQALVAFEIAPERLDAAGRTVAAHPGVSHCYGRAHRLNLWFTLAVPGARAALREAVDALAEACDARRSLLLPTIRRYKLHVHFALDADPSGSLLTPGRTADVPADPAGRAEQDALEWTAERRAAVRALQRDLPGEKEPFATVAAAEGLDRDDLLHFACAFRDAGVLRRYAAVLHHRRAGANANALVVWQVPPEEVDREGRRAAAHRAVSHCYHRPPAEGWDYRLYTMIHARTSEDLAMTLDELVTTTDLRRHEVLPTEKEYAKRRVRFFRSDAED